MQEEIEEIQEQLQEKISMKLFRHVVGVRYTAEALAMCHGVSMVQAGTAGVLHDCAKYMTGEKMLKKCQKHEIPISSSEEKNPMLLHAKLGAYLAEHKYGISDPEVLSAIRWHTTGKEDMTVLEQIVFLADYMEPHRKMIPGLDQVRKVAFRDLEEAVYLTLKNTVSYLEEQSRKTGKKTFDPTTQAAYRYYAAKRGRLESTGTAEILLP